MNENSNPLPMAELIGSGFFDLTINEEGVMIYTVSDNAKQINPEMFEQVRKTTVDNLMKFIEAGFVNIRFDDNLDLQYQFTKEGVEHMRSIGYPVVDDGGDHDLPL